MTNTAAGRASLGADPYDDEDDDAISVTSTVSIEHDSDEEFEVANILAEKTSEGDMVYLVEWEGFSLDQCTWEPASNLGPELRGLWEETKQKHRTGEEKPFNLEDLRDAIYKKALEKLERHRRRNAKRKRLGLALTVPFSDVDRESASEDNGGGIIEVDSHRTQSKHATTHSTVPPPPTARSSSMPEPKPSSSQRPSRKTQAETRRQNSQGSSRKPPPGPKVKPVPPPTPLSSSSSRGERTRAVAHQGVLPKKGKAPPKTDSSNNPLNAAAVARGTVPGRNLQTPSRRVYTAKKSGAATKTAPTNVFLGGATRRQRNNLQDTIADSTKDQRLFQSYRFRRLAEKGSRDKEDRAPNLEAVSANLFDISKGPASRQPSKDVPGKQGHEQQEKRGKASCTSFDASSTQPTQSLSRNEGQSKTKRKSVRFLPDEDMAFTPEPMSIDSPVANQQTPPSLTLETASPKCSLGGPLSGPTQSMNKSLRLGNRTRPIPVTIHGLPLEPNEPRLAQFLEEGTLDCSYSCFAKTFFAQVDHIKQSAVCAGVITSAENEGVLEVIAARLRAGIIGLYGSYSGYNLVIYPTKCEEWKWLWDQFAVAPLSPNEGALKYFIFTSTLDCGPFLRPIREAPIPTGDNPVSPLPGREELVRKFLGLKYADLVPAVLVGKDSAHNFFLALPQSKAALLQELYHWLRACNPDCRIYTSQHPGGWSAFRHAVEQEPGVIIVHELVTWSLHRFPSLHVYLTQNHDVYWCLSEATHPQPIFPSSPFLDETVPPGEMTLTRLFPNRTAIFITPSFLSSEPQRVSELLEWFVTNWMKNQQVKLLSAWDLRGYLEELAFEKLQARDEILQDPRGITQNELRANLKGLSQLDCEERFKGLLLATELHKCRVGEADSAAFNDDANPLIYADPSIDPNDEQSLVNWFGWWSSLRMDQFRGFHVVGSSPTIKYSGSAKGERVIQVPRYTCYTINSPDIVMDTVQQRYEPVEDPEVADISKTTPDVEGQNAPASDVPTKPWIFQSKHVPREDWLAFNTQLKLMGGKAGFIMCYLLAVSWTDSIMAQHFGDPFEDFRTMESWFKFAWSFVHPHSNPKNRSFNTYVGFFYTVAEEWDPKNPPPQARPQRHPWLAIYRPVNPFIKPYKRCELIIWDPAAPDKFPDGQAAREEELIYAQRQLIQLIREHGPEKNPGTWLDQVWIGGFRQPRASDSAFPIDITLEFLDFMLRDIKKYLPGSEAYMPDAGYKLLVTADNPSPLKNGVGDPSSLLQEKTPNQPDTGDEVHDDISDDEDRRIIFHPPRGRKLAEGEDTRCANRLYEAARRAQANATEPVDRMVYDFQHTLEWYEVQRSEGRGYEHINVGSWETIFNLFRIGSASALAVGDGGQKNGTESP